MIRLTRAQVQPIGLDIGYDSVKMLQLEVVNDSLAVLAAARMPFSAEARAEESLRMPAAIEMVRQLLRQNAFVGRRVVAAVPRQTVHTKTLRLPVMPPSELEAAVQFEARNIFTFDIDKARVHFLPVGEVRQGADVLHEVIVLAAVNEEVNIFVEQLHRCGVIIESLDVEPCALYRCVERFIRRREDEQEVNVLVDLGMRHSQVVMGRGREISFFKTIDIGGANLNDAVAGKLGISADEAGALRRRLADAGDAAAKKDSVRQAVFDAMRSVVEELGREVSLCLRYHSVSFRGHRPTRVRLFGGEANDASVVGVLAAMLPIPVETSRPLVSVNTSRMTPGERRGSMAEWAMAMSLGLKRTVGRFGARDGKPRETAASVNDTVAQSPAQNVDMAAVVQAAAVGAAAPDTAPARAEREASHA